jgi:hypothetical protein
LRWIENVRLSCWKIIAIINIIVVFVRLIVAQNDNCIIRIIKILIDIVNWVLRMFLNDIGSNDEKMSDIMSINKLLVYKIWI